MKTRPAYSIAVILISSSFVLAIPNICITLILTFVQDLHYFVGGTLVSVGEVVLGYSIMKMATRPAHQMKNDFGYLRTFTLLSFILVLVVYGSQYVWNRDMLFIVLAVPAMVTMLALYGASYVLKEKFRE